MAVDQRVMDIADAAVDCIAPSKADVRYLLEFDAYSVEAAYVEARARQIAFAASDGQGTIHAQIGVDAHPCAANCQYCAFAQVNSGVCEDVPELSLAAIVDAAQVFSDSGVHLVSLMSTATLPFERYLRMVEAVVSVVRDDVIVMANTRDVSLSEARALKSAGARAAYHAVRLGEGTFTSISPEVRRRSIAHIREAGLELMTGVEPVWEGADRDEMAERICELPTFGPFCIGACGLTSTAGTVLAEAGMVSPRTGFVRYIGALTRLTCGYEARLGGVGGSVWVDAGTDPRKRGYGDDAATLRAKVARARTTLERDGWTV